MISAVVVPALFALAAAAVVPLQAAAAEAQAAAAPRHGVGKRCGGKGWSGTTTCDTGLLCNHTNEFWWDCQAPVPPATAAAPAAAAPAAAAAPPLAGAAATVDEINTRFATGGAGSDLGKAGVLVHQFHNGMDGDWRPWMPCPPTCYGGPCWCAAFSDRFSTSVLNAKTVGPKGIIGMYSTENPGFILAPWAMKVSCGYPADGGSESKSCKPGEVGCVPGCGKKWCQFNPAIPNNMDTSCAWHPDELERVLALQENSNSRYNEVVVDAKSWVDNLPGSIEAIFYVKGSKAEQEARKVHAAFLKEFAGKSLSARGAPLLEMDPKNAKAPFSDVTNTRPPLQAYDARRVPGAEAGGPAAPLPSLAARLPAGGVAGGVAGGAALATALVAAALLGRRSSTRRAGPDDEDDRRDLQADNRGALLLQAEADELLEGGGSA